jgi:hypothetical protein
MYIFISVCHKRFTVGKHFNKEIELNYFCISLFNVFISDLSKILQFLIIFFLLMTWIFSGP